MAVMPSLYRQIRLAVLAVLAFSTSVVDVALILGPTTPAPLAVRILDWQNDADLDAAFSSPPPAQCCRSASYALALVDLAAGGTHRRPFSAAASRSPAGAPVPIFGFGALPRC